MKNRLACLLLLLSLLASLSSLGTEVVSVDAQANKHPIDPRIYGVNNADAASLTALNLPINRSGGTPTSRYNWQQNAYNVGDDYYFESVALDSATPGEFGDSFITASKTAGAQAMLTIPMLDWVAKLDAGRGTLASFSVKKYGAQKDHDPNTPDFGNGVLTSGKFVTGNDPNDANVASTPDFQEGWIKHIIGQFGLANAGGLRYYMLDQEPGIWYVSHRDVHPDGAKMEEVRDRMIALAKKIRANDPNATIVGPDEWNYEGYLASGYDEQFGALNGFDKTPDRDAHGGMDYLPWLLDQLHQNEVAGNPRLLDIFSVHYYPQGGEFSDDVSPAMQALRNRSTRSLWDPNYVDETYLNTQLKVIPRIKGWAAQYYPNTQVAINEYSWGAEGHINGATAQADVLGIFGREGLDMACRWEVPAAGTPVANAFKMYRNYDGAKAHFGEMSVSAAAAHPDNLSAFAAVRTDGALTVMVINKVATDNPLTLNVLHFASGAAAQVWQLSATNSITKLADAPLASGGLNTQVPAQSITLFVIPAGVKTPGPQIESPPTAAPNPVLVDTAVAFSVAATDSNNLALTYAWDFGDASTGTGASTTHAYAAAGTFTATVKVSDGVNPAVSAAVSVTVNAPLSLTISKASIKLNFGKGGADSISFSGTIAIPDGFNPDGAPVSLNVGGVLKTLTLNAKGSAVDGGDSVKITIKSKKGVVAAQTSRFSVTFKNGDFAATLLASGLTDETIQKSVTVDYSIILRDLVYKKTQTLNYTAKGGVSGSAK